MKSISILASLVAVAAAGNHHKPPANPHAAAYPAANPPPAQAAAAQGNVHTIVVGGTKPPADPAGTPTPNLAFTPPSIQAAPGDIVRFEFLQTNHTVTQSTFAQPCAPMPGGKDSGFLPNPDGTTPGPTFDFTVASTDAVWMFCAQGPHCSKGMVFAINAAATGEKTFEAYKALALGSANGTGQAAGGQATGGLLAGTPAPAQSSTVTLVATSVAVADPGAATGAATGAAAAPSGSVAQGQGTTPGGQPCACSCLCGVNSFPPEVGQGMFGGFLGQLPSTP
ncbi:hypothetical protein P152DRAFT_80313 [Eremomyces bilateralis CBS 781.70]|uniref:Cupredoxin n=1 Tax=Eremomyces bilateralis CBS 781.70 TaxID=1392243 RepID=A0A6G1FZP3_9PEZI|nr:uncharacterized protein P152DRAFT_80313 [Eremomyces bilateralis CBS 781.70]KAF1811140.1 hypothetical protein P152DRAFT_80313 [Eremomyces bilateralis CBS 781.70]